MSDKQNKKDLLSHILDVLQISESGRQEIRKQFGEILLEKFWLAFINQLPEEKKSRFLSFLKQPGINAERVAAWFKKENILFSPQSRRKIEAVLKNSIKELVGILVRDIDHEERAQLLALIKEGNKK